MGVGDLAYAVREISLRLNRPRQFRPLASFSFSGKKVFGNTLHSEHVEVFLK